MQAGAAAAAGVVGRPAPPAHLDRGRSESGLRPPTTSPERANWSLDTERIDRERILRGLSQERLARAARVDPGTLSDLLAGRRQPQLGTIGAIARALELELGDLIEFG